MKTSHRVKGGFTLIELLVVISIIGVLSSVILVSLNAARAKGTQASALIFATNAYHALYSNALVYLDFNNGQITNYGLDNVNIATSTGVSLGADTSLHRSGYVLQVPYGSVTSYPLIATDNNNIYASCSSVSVIPICAAFNSGNFSFAGWYQNTSSVNGVNDYLVFGSQNGTWTQLSLTANSSGVNLVKVKVGGSVVLSIPVNILLNVWAHYAYSVYNTGSSYSVRLFVNGLLVGSTTLSTLTSYTDANQLHVAGGCCSFISFGNYDDVGFYNAPLTTSMVEKLYAEGAAAHGIALK